MEIAKLNQAVDRALTAIEADMLERRGIRHLWEEMYPEVKAELRQTWKVLIIAEIVAAWDDENHQSG